MSSPKPWIISVLGSSSEAIKTKLNQLSILSDAVQSLEPQGADVNIANPAGGDTILLKYVAEFDRIDLDSSAVALIVDIDSYDKNTDIPNDIQIYKQLLTSKTLKSQKILLWFLNVENVLRRINASQLRAIFPQDTFGYGHAQDPAIGLAWGDTLRMGVDSWFGDLFQAVVNGEEIANAWLTYAYFSSSNGPEGDLDWLRKVAKDEACKAE